MDEKETEQESGIPFGGQTAGEFYDAMAQAMARSLVFEGHGNLAENEQIAFIWGFRHGVFALHEMLRTATLCGENTTKLVTYMTDEASGQWSLRVKLDMTVLFSDMLNAVKNKPH